MNASVKALLDRFLRLQKQNVVLFESKPDYADNTLALYLYIREHNLLPGYRLLWYAEDKGVTPPYPTLFPPTSPLRRLKYHSTLMRSKALIFCNVPIPKEREDQLSMYLAHGGMIKRVRGSYNMPADLDYFLSPAAEHVDMARYEYTLSDRTEIEVLGFPRNDDLLNPPCTDREALFGQKFKKLIIWYPTFRQNKNYDLNHSSVTLPFLHDAEAARKLNDCAAANDTLIVLKPHFAQDTGLIRQEEMSNLRIIDDSFFPAHSIRPYQMMALSDALLTDYSSIYHDYLLLDRPIGLCWEDLEEYKARGGFVMEPEKLCSGGERLDTLDDLCAFLGRVARGEDVRKEARHASNDFCNTWKDAQSARRVAEFLAGKLLRKA